MEELLKLRELPSVDCSTQTEVAYPAEMPSSESTGRRASQAKKREPTSLGSAYNETERKVIKIDS